MTPDEIKALRERLNISQEELAHRLPVSVKTVSRWENGHSKPSRIFVRLMKEME